MTTSEKTVDPKTADAVIAQYTNVNVFLMYLYNKHYGKKLQLEELDRTEIRRLWKEMIKGLQYVFPDIPEDGKLIVKEYMMEEVGTKTYKEYKKFMQKEHQNVLDRLKNYRKRIDLIYYYVLYMYCNYFVSCNSSDL